MEEDGEMVSTPKVFRHKTRRKKRKRFNPYLPTAPCDESTWEPEDEVVSCPVVTSDMSVSDALIAVACRVTSCTKWEDAAVTCAEIAEATCAPGSTAFDLAEAWLLSSQDDEVIEVGILAALTRSLVPGIAERADPSELRLVSANVTAWNNCGPGAWLQRAGATQPYCHPAQSPGGCTERVDRSGCGPVA